MILRYQYLSQHTKVFQTMTRLPIGLFDELHEELTEPFREAERQRLKRVMHLMKETWSAFTRERGTLTIRKQRRDLLICSLWVIQLPIGNSTNHCSDYSLCESSLINSGKVREVHNTLLRKTPKLTIKCQAVMVTA